MNKKKDLTINEENYNHNLEIFDVVSSFYVDLDGNHKTGVFLIIYQEEKDANDYNNHNFTALKVTSKDVYANIYRVLARAGECPGLNRTSFIYTNKPYTLLASKCRFIGKLPSKLCEEVMEKLHLYLNELNKQTTTTLLSKIRAGE